jgi:hypothetical protein
VLDPKQFTDRTERTPLVPNVAEKLTVTVVVP